MSVEAGLDLRFAWKPQKGPQTSYVHCPVEEIFYGGARGGGKTDGSLGRALIRALKYKSAFKGYFFRRELTQLEAAIGRSKEVYSKFGTYYEQKKTWIFRGGGTLSFRYIEKDADAEKYQGASATDIYIEEIGNFPDLKPLLKLKGILRSTKGVPVCFCATGNPGGPGHSLVKRRYIEPAPGGLKPIRERDELTGLVSERIYIPARVTDNMLLMRNDPGYIARLAQTGSEALVRAWIDGSFDVIEGAFFDKFSTHEHVLRAAPWPKHWLQFRAGDWGSYYPFYFCWCVCASEDWVHPDGAFIPRGSIIVVREWYGSKDHNNDGLKMPADDVGRELLRIERRAGLQPSYGVLDPSAFKQDGGPSVVERMARASGGKIRFRRADNTRLGADGAMGGWDHLRARINGTPLMLNDGHMITRPTIYFYDTCVDVIRTLPAMQHDPDHPEDLYGSEDHPSDAVRYAVMSRPWLMKPQPKAQPIKDFRSSTLDELWAAEAKAGRRRADWRV